jgi:chemotaxis signal transduction protein
VSDRERAIDPAVQRMRAEFDRAFSSPAVPPVRDRARLLGIRVGGDPFALALDDVVAIHVDRKIVPVPSAAATLLGIASFRGALAPVHDLRLVLGYPARAPTRWLVLVAGQTPIGLAFDAFDGQLATPSAQETPPAAGTAAAAPRSRSSALTRGLVHAGDTIRPLIDVAAVLTALGSRPAGTPENKER